MAFAVIVDAKTCRRPHRPPLGDAVKGRDLGLLLLLLLLLLWP